MSVENTPPIDNGSQNPPSTPSGEGANGNNTNPTDNNGGGLPSAQDNAPKLNFEITDTVKEKFITADGKLLGKYETLEQLADAHKNLQDKHAQYVEEVKNNEKNINTDIAAQQVEAKKIETMQSLLPDFLNNNMQLTPEMETVLTEAGLDIRDVKLGALELRDRIATAHEVVGGKENYEAMMGWATQALNDADKAAFDKDIMSAQSRFAIKGLFQEYQTAVEKGETTPQQRLNGDTTVRTVQPYASRQELMRDKAYIDSNAGKRDIAAQNAYKARLAITPDAVWRGR